MPTSNDIEKPKETVIEPATALPVSFGSKRLSNTDHSTISFPKLQSLQTQ